jgi:asparaginyl-tRNA synthetase
MRMDYRDAIAWLNEHNITRVDDEGVEGPHVVGDDIAEAAERKMTDMIGKPIFLHGFPKEIVRPPSLAPPSLCSLSPLLPLHPY